MIQITQSGVIVSDSNQIAHLHEEFDRQHCVVIPSLIESHLLQRIVFQYLDRAKFIPNSHGEEGEFAKELAVHGAAPVVHLFHLLLNRSELFRVVQQITGCSPIGNFVGRIYRRLPDSDHYDSWHDDIKDHRMIGMSINFSSEVFSGGVFQLRDRQSLQILHQIANTGFGDACMFRIRAGLEHRVTRVEGQVSKTAGAGWFRSHPDTFSVIQSFFSEPPNSTLTRF